MSSVQPDEGHSEETPDLPEVTLEQIDELIAAWLGQERGSGTLLTGWVLSFGVTSFDDEGKPWYEISYATGPQTNMATAVGLAVVGQRQQLADITGIGAPTDDEDEP